MGSSGDPKKAIGLLQQTMSKALLGAEPHFITKCKHCLRMTLICKPGEWDLDITQGIGGNDVAYIDEAAIISTKAQKPNNTKLAMSSSAPVVQGCPRLFNFGICRA